MSLIAEITVQTGGNRCRSIVEDPCNPCPCPPAAPLRRVRTYQELVPCNSVKYRCQEVTKCTPLTASLREAICGRLWERPQTRTSSIQSSASSSALAAVRPARPTHSASIVAAPAPIAVSPSPLPEPEPAPVATSVALSTPTEAQLPAIRAALQVADQLGPPPEGKVTYVNAPVASRPVTPAPASPVPIAVAEPAPVVLPQQALQPLRRQNSFAVVPTHRRIREALFRPIRSNNIDCTPYEVLKPIFVRGICWRRCEPVPDPCEPQPDPCATPTASQQSAAPTASQASSAVPSAASALAIRPASVEKQANTGASAAPSAPTASQTSSALVAVSAASAAAAAATLSSQSKALSLTKTADGYNVLEIIVNNQTIRIEF